MAKLRYTRMVRGGSSRFLGIIAKPSMINWAGVVSNFMRTAGKENTEDNTHRGAAPATHGVAGLPGVPYTNERGAFQFIRRPILWEGMEPSDILPPTSLFLDLETCGLRGSPLFLVGTLHPTPTGPVLTQFFARDLQEEAAVLRAAQELFAISKVLVTFNGKGFDWPYVADRLAFHRLPQPPLLAHVDLLHLARKRYKKELPNCKLQTLEKHLFGMEREHDLGGAEIPAAYYHYMRTGKLQDILRILEHNAHDMLTMVRLIHLMR